MIETQAYLTSRPRFLAYSFSSACTYTVLWTAFSLGWFHACKHLILQLKDSCSLLGVKIAQVTYVHCSSSPAGPFSLSVLALCGQVLGEVVYQVVKGPRL